jgi:neutral ceramidase
MRIKVFIFLGLVSFSVLTSGQSLQNKSNLEVGVGVVDITGKDAVILDPLHVRAMVFRQGFEQFAIVECEVGAISKDLTIPARQQSSLKTGIPFEKIIVAATHTHKAHPHKDLLPAIVQAVSDAQASLKPVKLKSSLGYQFNVSFNRRYYMKDGSIVFNPMFLNPNIVRPVGPIDPELEIAMFYDAATNAPLSCLLNFALHLDIVGDEGPRASLPNSVSADYPYWIELSLRKDFGSNFNSLFLTGSCGNINHWDFSKPGPQRGHDTKSKQVGDSLYNSMKRALKSEKEESPSLASRYRVINVPVQSYTVEDLAWAKDLQGNSLSGKSEVPDERQQFLNKVRKNRILTLDALKQQGMTSLPIDIQVFRLSDNTAIVTLPGEPFVEHGLTVKNYSPFENTMVVELASYNISDNSLTYIPNKRAYWQGEYEVENSILTPGGGEMLVNAIIKMLKELKEDVN